MDFRAHSSHAAAPGAPASFVGIRYASGRGRFVLLATVLGSGMVMLDGTIVSVALPRIGSTFAASVTGLQWVVNAYMLTLAGLLLLSGALADRFGRRRLFLIGVSWFALASAGCAAAPTIGALIAMRALQGVGGALLTPGSLAILQAVFVEEDRSTAVGAWTGLGGLASAIGPLLGGALTQLAPWTWRLAFLLNLPLAGLVAAVTLRYVPETRGGETRGPLDLAGAALAAFGLGGLVYGLTEGTAHGHEVAALGPLLAGVAALAGFFWVEVRSANPLMPLGLFRSRQFAGANLSTLLVYAALGGAFFLLPLYLQKVVGLSPLAAGSALLPITVVLLLLSARMGRISEQIGPRLPMTVGPVLAAAGLTLLARLGPAPSYVGAVLPAVLVFALGLAATVAPLTATVLASAPANVAGVASAINNEVARVGSLLAVAVLPALAGMETGEGVDAALREGFRRGMLIAAGCCASGGAVALVTIRRQAR